MKLGLTTSTEAVRAVLGVSEESNELPDQYFVDREMEEAVYLELSRWLPDTLANLFAAYNGSVEGDDDWKIWFTIKQAATFWCASACLKSGALSFFLRVEDGQNKLARNATDFEALEKKLYYQYLVYKNEALALSGTAATTQNWIVRKASPSYDPVSNI